MSVLLRRPAALGRVPGELAQRAPPFISRGTRLLDGSANVCELAHEIVELRLYLAAHPPPTFCHVEPSPHAARHRTNHCGQQYTRSLIHVGPPSSCRRLHTRTPASLLVNQTL